MAFTNTVHDPLTINLAKQTRALLCCIPAESIYAQNVIQASSPKDLLSTLSRLLAVPALTLLVAKTFRPLLLDLCVRWLHDDDDLENRFAALCLLIEPHEEIFPVFSVFLRKPFFENGPLDFVMASLAPGTLDSARLHRVLLAYYRLLQANRLLPHHRIWSLSPLSALIWTPHPDTGVRWLAIRCYSLQSGMGEAEREKIETCVLGEICGVDCPITYEQNTDGIVKELDGWLLPTLETKRIIDARNALIEDDQNFYTYEDGDICQPLLDSDLSRSTANIHGVFLLRSSVPSEVSPTVVATPSAIESLRVIALHISSCLPILLTSAPSSGKSLFLSYLASALYPSTKNKIVTVHLADTSLDPRSLLGSYVSSPTQLGTFEWKDGILVRAMKEGRWVVFEDIDRGSSEVLGLIKPLVESLGLGNWIGCRAAMEVPHRGRVEAEEGFAIFATRSVMSSRNDSFPSPSFFGAHKFHEINVSSPTATEVKAIIDAQFPKLAGSTAQALIELWGSVRSLGSTASVRSVGLRELEKFCHRIETLLPPNHQPMDIEFTPGGPAILTSVFPNPTIREDIYLEARDVFFGAGTLTASARAHCDRMADVVAEHLGLDSDRRRWVLTGRTPDFEVEKDVNGQSVSVRVGRTRLLARSTRASIMPALERPFAMHKPAVCLLSRIATAVSLAEPVLLTGETGTGKTSVVTHLASLLRRPLISLNLSHQTESSDLLGGFKPIDARIPGAILQERFLELFGRTFSWKKNAKFSDTVRKAVADAKWKRVVGLWKESVRLARDRIHARQNENAADDVHKNVDADAPRKRRKVEATSLQESEVAWSAFQEDVEEFEVQHTQGKGKFAFDFVEGPLVRALRSGDWILLDEINLASPETLECITGLLRGPTASITLTEQGSLEPVPRHPDFRLFACMNPATDVGKKDLPPNIRSRFTEIDVPPPDADRETLLSIVAQYIGPSAVGDKAAIMNVAEFYSAVKKLAEDRQIADGSNHRPHYSMRTLARALTFAADIASAYSLRRALWEGCLMAFTMVLDQPSSEIVTNLAQKHVLAGVRNPRSLLSKEPSVPKTRPPEDFVKFGPFYLEKGGLTIDPFDDYIITPSVEKKLVDLARIIITRRFPVLIEGPTSSGKTSSIEYLARRTGHRFIRINNHDHTDIQEYLGSYVSDPNTGKLVFKDGLLVRALRNGDWIVLDELNLAPTDVLEALNRLLDDNRELIIPETQEVIRPHPHFMLFATQNPPGVYAGRKVLSRAFRNRFLEVHFEDVPQVELETILCQRCRIAPSYSQRIVSVFRELQKRRQSGRVFESKQGFATLRDLFRWAGRDAIGYQELAENGYMLLAERARRDDDKVVVKEVIESVMKVRIDEKEMYNFRDGMDHFVDCPIPSKSQIVWTAAMRRLFVLVARALRFNEPVLLVGETGSGKTSVCQIFAEITSKQLYAVNCHQNTETADLIGGLRPIRNRSGAQAEILREVSVILERLGLTNMETDVRGLIERIAGLLNTDLDATVISSLKDLHHRLLQTTSIFEWNDGPLVDAMRNGDVFLLDEISLADDSVLERLNSVLEPGRTIVLAERGGDNIDYSSIHAAEGFKLMATMNPGGDYGKKELSPALRNRFTEIWVPPVDNRSDLHLIVESSWGYDIFKPYTNHLLDFTEWLQEKIDRSVCSLRDILAWVNFSNAVYSTEITGHIQMDAIFHHAAHMTFIDGFGSLPQLSGYSSDALRELEAETICKLQELVPSSDHDGSLTFARDSSKLVQLGSFAISKGPEEPSVHNFSLQAPTTRENASRVLRACQVPKPILLEGSPGVGKTALITALANITGHHLCRINLSDQTDLIDLFGSDLPVEDGQPGEFAWKDAEFLRAVQEGYWVLLDEMNLAPQAVLEGLNAILDHRGSVYIPELGRSFNRHPAFRVFAAQNPLHQGGGRKGLPKSFVNRFTKVYMEDLSADDLLLISQQLFPERNADILRAMITYNTRLNQEVVIKRSFGRDGSPWEFNLRDVIRWGELLRSYGFSGQPIDCLRNIYLNRFRLPADRESARLLFEDIFSVSTSHLTYAPYPFLSPSHFRIGRFEMARKNTTLLARPRCVLQSHLSALESIGTCISQSWLVILTGRHSTGKTELLRVMANLTGNHLHELSINSATDTMDILGSFEQVDHHARVYRLAEQVLLLVEQTARYSSGSAVSYTSYYELRKTIQFSSSNFVPVHRILQSVASVLHDFDLCVSGDRAGPWTSKKAELELQMQCLTAMPNAIGRFEWVDGPLVQAMKEGFWLVLDGANLCNPSVLDRLNSLCELDGVLALSERGYVDGKVPMLRPHPNFRLFMTVDPHHGELSRAMRNRGIETAVLGDFTEEDERRLCDYLRFPQTQRMNSPIAFAMYESVRRGIYSQTPFQVVGNGWPSGSSVDQDVASSFLGSHASFFASLPSPPPSSVEKEALPHFLVRAVAPNFIPIWLRFLHSLDLKMQADLALTQTMLRDFLTSGLSQVISSMSRSYVSLTGMSPSLAEYQVKTSKNRGIASQEVESLPKKDKGASQRLHDALGLVLQELQTTASVVLRDLSHDTQLDMENCELSIKLLPYARYLRSAMFQESFDHSAVQVISKWMDDALRGSRPAFSRLAHAARLLEDAVSLTSGQGISQIWSTFFNRKASSIPSSDLKRLENAACLIILVNLNVLDIRREVLHLMAASTVDTIPLSKEQSIITDLVDRLGQHLSDDRNDRSRQCHDDPCLLIIELFVLSQANSDLSSISSCFKESFPGVVFSGVHQQGEEGYIAPLTTLLSFCEQATNSAFLRAFQRFLKPALYHMATQHQSASNELSALGRCWIALSRFILELFVPNVPVDPSSFIRCSSDFWRHEEALLLHQLNLHFDLERQTTSNGSNSVIRHLNDSLAEVRERLDNYSTDIPHRPDIARLHMFWSEVQQFLAHVLSPPKIDALLLHLESGDPSTFVREEVVQESISAFCQRLDMIYPDFQDIAIVIQLALLHMRLGLRLARCSAQLSADTAAEPSAKLAKALISFPSVQSADMLRTLGESTPHTCMSALEHILLNLSATAVKTSLEDITEYTDDIELAYEQIFRLWRIDRTRADGLDRESQSLYRRSGLDHDATAEAVAEEQDFLELFPTFEDVLEEENQSRSQINYKENSCLVNVLQVEQLLGIHYTLFELPPVFDVGFMSSTSVKFRQARRVALSSLLETSSSSLPDILDSMSLPLQFMLLQDQLSELKEAPIPSKAFNFYTDANLIEAQKATLVLEALRTRLTVLGEDWPDQMVLQHLKSRCETILAFDFRCPIAKILSALEQLLVQTNDWEMYAHRENNLKSHQHALTSLIIDWRRLELSCWQTLLRSHSDSFASTVSEYWFHLYEVTVQGTLAAVDEGSEVSADYLRQLTNLLDDFICSSPIGQFQPRMRLLASFGSFVSKLMVTKAKMYGSALERVQLILKSTWRYYQLFSLRLSTYLEDQRSTLEKEVEGFIKLASWKDVNVQALKQSAQRTHHNLYKIIRKYRDTLRQPIADRLLPVFAGDGECQLMETTRTRQSSPPPLLSTSLSISGKPALLGPAYLTNLAGTLQKFETFIESRVQTFLQQYQAQVVDQMAVDVIVTSQNLANEVVPPSLSQEKRRKYGKTILVRKRRAWSDLLKELKRMGLSANLKPEMLCLLRDDSWIRQQPIMATASDSIFVEKGEVYFDRLRGALPSLRALLPNHHSDIATRDLLRGITLLESGYSLALDGRNRYVLFFSYRKALILSLRLARTLASFQELHKISKRLEILAQAPKFTKFGHSLFAELRSILNTLNKASHALDELAEGVETFDNLNTECTVTALAKKAKSICICTTAFPLVDEHMFVLDVVRHLRGLPIQLNEMLAAEPRLHYLLHPVENWISEQGIPTLLPSDLSRTLEGNETNVFIDVLLINVQTMLSHCPTTCEVKPSEPTPDGFIRNGLRIMSQFTSLLDVNGVVEKVRTAADQLSGSSQSDTQERLKYILPFLRRYTDFAQEQLMALAEWIKALFKLCFVLCSVMHNVAKQGFCTPPDVEDSGSGPDSGEATGGVGLGEGAGSENVSKEIEDESQVEGLKGDDAEDAAQKEHGDDKDAIEMGDDFGGEMEDVPDTGSQDEGSDSESDQELDEQIEDLGPSDPSAVDEKLWGDESGPDSNEMDQTQQDRSTANEDNSDVVAKEEKEEKQRDKPIDSKKEEETREGDSMDDVGDDAANSEHDQEDKDSDFPNANGAPIDNHIPDADTLDLPEDMKLEDDLQGPPDAEDIASEDEGQLDENTDVPMKDDTPHDGSEPLDEDDVMEPPHNMEGDDTRDEGDNEMDAGAVAQPDLSAGEGESGMDDPTQGQDGSTEPQTSGSSGEMKPDDMEPKASENALEQTGGPEEQSRNDLLDASQAVETSTSATQRGEGSSQESNDLANNPMRNLGDALKEIQQRFQEIFDGDASVKEPIKQSDKPPDQVEYDYSENVDHDMQALGPAGEEQVAKLNDLKLVDHDQPKDEAGAAMDMDISPTEQQEKIQPISSLHAKPSTEGVQDDVEGAIAQIESRSNGSKEPLPSVPDASLMKAESDMDDSEEVTFDRAEAELRTWQAQSYSEDGAERIWRLYETLTHDLSYALCEQLRLILEPTMATRLKGDYRTGKRLNMKKIIPYIASDYTKDKIWLRRTRPSQREYQILIALDDSRSMAESHSVHLAYETLALVSKALSRLEVGDIAIAKFGEAVDIIHGFDEGPFTDQAGTKVVNAFRFDQKATNVLSLVETSLKVLEVAREGRSMRSASAADLWQLEIIISDGICQDHDRLRAMLRRAAGQRVMIVFIVIDSLHSAAGSTDNRTSSELAGSQNSILSMNQVAYKMVDGRMELQMERYMDSFPFDYYVVLRSVEALPEVLSGTLRQFFERISEE
ncbi:hypothetical protein SERLA73DRAFT_110025 [Serpula lacrymans var. lacrymans S7.3]|uniref:Midasin n=1 Tax=Serpula lacrymans var. lacrymans (strain S7.3) TaxID=936435 RepID=F8Q023_SERL3|nr:hypothetical protein SERLA73DRAFT_110025 [Serpula lacrymans var. lacrymans S7.3]